MRVVLYSWPSRTHTCPVYSSVCFRDFPSTRGATSLPLDMAQQLPNPVDSVLDHLLQAIRDGLRLYPAHAGAVRVVIESEAGEPLHVVKIDARLPPASKPALPPLRLRPTPLAELIAATAALQVDGWERRDAQDQGLLQRCLEQQQRIAELEQRLQEMHHELHHHATLPSPTAPSSPSSSTDDDSSSCDSGTGDSSQCSHGSNTDENDREPSTSIVAMTDDADDASPSPLSCPQASDIFTAVRKSERSKTNVERWCPPAQHAAFDRAAESAPPSSSHPRKHKAKRRRRSRRDDDDREQSISSDVMSVEVETADDETGGDDDDAVEVAALVAKLREGYDKRTSVSLDALCKESVLSLRQHVLDEAADRGVAPTIAGQITALITTSTSLKMVGYYLRAILAHRLKTTSQKCYRRLARDTLGLKSPADIAAYPALFEFVQHHYPGMATATVEAWLENPIITADLTWTEWKRYLTKQGRVTIDAALQRFKAATAPFQDWMQLGWVEIYDDEKLGQGVRALRDIHLPTSKAKEAQRDVTASISVVAADLHWAGPECVLDKDAAREADPMYLVQFDKQRVFDARHHWMGKINHLPDRLCNLKLTSTGKLVQTREIAVGEALTFEYGVDYWVYQLSGLELSDCLVSNSAQSNRGTLDVFRRMHDSVLDYTALLSCDWVRRRPVVRSELEREMWIEHLTEYLRERVL